MDNIIFKDEATIGYVSDLRDYLFKAGRDAYGRGATDEAESYVHTIAELGDYYEEDLVIMTECAMGGVTIKMLKEED